MTSVQVVTSVQAFEFFEVLLAVFYDVIPYGILHDYQNAEKSLTCPCNASIG